QLVERGIDLVQETERRGLIAEDREEERERRHRFLAARHQRDMAEALARRLRDHVDAGLEDVVSLFEDEVGAPAAEEDLEDLDVVDTDRLERLDETLSRAAVDSFDRLPQRGHRVFEILLLRAQRGVALFERLELVDRHEIDRSDRVDLRL